MKKVRKEITSTTGFAYLIGVLVVSVIAIAIVVTLFSLSITSSKMVIVERQFFKAKAGADSCAELAIQRVKDDPAYSGGEEQSLDEGSCTYNVTNTLLEDGTRTAVIKASADINNTIRKVMITVVLSNLEPPGPPQLSLVSWQEQADF